MPRAAQMKAPTWVRDAVDVQIRYKWVETGPLEHYRHAHAFDHIGAELARQNPPACCSAHAGPLLDSVRLLGDYERFLSRW